MNNIIFDVRQKTGYNTKGIDIYYQPCSNINNYICAKHILAYFKYPDDVNFKIKCSNGDFITVDSRGFASGSYKVYSLEFYYNKHNSGNPVIFGVLIQPGGVKVIQRIDKYYFPFREITAHGKDSTVKLTSLTKIDSLNQGVLDYEYKAVNTEIKIDLNHGNGNYEAETSKCIGDMGKCTVNVNVTGPSQLSGVDFVYYTYTFKGDGFNLLEINQTIHILTSFEGSDFNDINLDSIVVYYYIQDSERILPLVIEFRPKSGKQFPNQKKEKSVFYKLNAIISDEDDNDLNKRKCFYSIDKSESYIKNKLQSIYKDDHIRLNIEKLIGLKKDTMTEYIILGVILLIYIPVAVLSYIYYNKIMSALRSVYNKFSNCITKS